MSENVGEQTYKITKKVIQGINLEGYIIEDNAGKEQALELEEVIKLARAGRISNAEAVLNVDSLGFSLYTDEKLSDMPTVKNVNHRELTLTYRIISSDGKCLGYKAFDANGKTYKLTINKAWNLAVNNSIKDVKAVILNGYKVLLSMNDFKLSELPRIQQ